MDNNYFSMGRFNYKNIRPIDQTFISWRDFLKIDLHCFPRELIDQMQETPQLEN